MASPSTQSPQRYDVEAIVRQVLAELLGRGVNGLAGKTNPTGKTSTDAAPKSGELTVGKKIVTAADLEGRLSGIKRLLVQRGAVVTPSARDELRKHGVAIASTVLGGKQTSTIHLAMAETNFRTDSLLALLTSEGLTVQEQAAGSLLNVIDDLCKTVATGNQRGLLLTGVPAAALCVANRQNGVRAVLGTSLADFALARAAVAANLLVIDPKGRSLFELRQLTRELLQGGDTCPAEVRQRLG